MKLSIRQPAQHFGPNGAHQRSIEIAVDQRQHIGKAGQIGVEFFSIFKRMTPFVQADIERFVRRVNSQNETNDQEWCTSRDRPYLRAPARAKTRNASFRLSQQIARDLMWQERPIGKTMSKSLFGFGITASMLLWTVASVSAYRRMCAAGRYSVI
jgi:hypothetical protein